MLMFLITDWHIHEYYIQNKVIRPQSEYASSVWDPYTQENYHKLEMIERRGARYVKNDYRHESSVTEMILDLGWRSLLQLILLYRMINGHVAVDYSITSSQSQGILDTFTQHSTCTSYHMNKEVYTSHSFLEQ